MAARTSASVGVGITITILGLLTLGLFITSMVFFTQRRSALDRVAGVEATTSEYLSDADRNDAIVQRLKDAAKKEKKTLVRLMLDQRREILTRATGSDRDDAATLAKILDDEKGSSLAALVRDRNSQIESLKKQVTDSEAAAARARLDKENEVKRVKDIEQAQKQTVAALTAQVDQTKAETDAMRDEVNKFKALMDERVERIKTEYAGKEGGLKTDIDKLQSERVVSLQRIRSFEEQLRGQRYSGPSEYALVDGEIVATNPVDKAVTISVGKKNKVVLGLTFTVYSQGTPIKPDEKTGEYPAGKATVEVIRVDEESSVARVLREQKGSPIVRGDSIANAVYDPNKKYKFLVFGNFDPQRTGIASPLGAGEVKAWIEEWGGNVSEDLAGDTDFIVLGSKPALPPEPSSSAPFEYVNEYIRLQRIARRYDELFKQASDASIPVLNENRLRTLIGK